MKLSAMSPQRYELLNRLSNLPKKILALHDHDHVVDYLLYELCSHNYFDLKKAAFFVDNPDFDCCKGIAGFSKQDYPQIVENLWEERGGGLNPVVGEIGRSTFNKKVRSTSYASVIKNNRDAVIGALSKQLEIRDPSFLTFPVRHQNHGVFIYETEPLGVKETHEFMDQGVSLLGFCPLI